MTFGLFSLRSSFFLGVLVSIGFRWAPFTAMLGAVEFPLRVSESGRYLEDQKKDPFLWVGDSPWGLFLQNDATLKRYFDDRSRQGFTVLQTQMLPESGTGKFTNGLEPFGIPGNFATPNDRFFDRVAGIIRYAGNLGMLVVVNPVWLGCCDGGWREVVKANGAGKNLEFGRYLGRKFRRLENILWLHGGDTDPRPWMDEVRSIAEGIRETAPTHRLHAVHCGSTIPSRELLTKERWLTVNLTVASSPADPGVEGKSLPVLLNLKLDYEVRPTLPFVSLSPGYGQGPTPTDQALRRDAWQGILSGAAGHTLGNPAMLRFSEGWETALSSPASRAMSHLGNLLGSVRWQRLVPDFDHSWMVAGHGEIRDPTRYNGSDHASVAADPDGVMVIAYIPSPRRISMDLSKFRLPVLARWFDPSNGVLSDVSKEKPELPSTGRQEFLPPGKNSAGDGDWVLVLDGRPVRRPLSR